ncbi:MAG: hypothetical protein FJZ47_17970 [Candidatus Tectomicrobia bacterium]|uniref:Uncharacterized protein n=1 Tax=Tectimicrobiota bacterium TaxID=2528274 RepID=A0A937W587_UNCTE|nr:hypothetical protein [Candidatus Tectomicrobia bacterium]
MNTSHMKLWTWIGGFFLLLVGGEAAAQSLTHLQFDILGLRLQVSPETLTVPKNIPTQIATQLVSPGGAGSEAATAIATLTAGTTVEAELRGPGIPLIPLSVKAGQPLPIPALALPGAYFLDHIRLVKDGQVVLDATPPTVPITVINEILVTSVTSRPLSLEEIQQKGVVIDQNNFQAFNFQLALNIQGTPFTIDLPVALPTRDFLRFTSDRAQIITQLGLVNRALADRQVINLPPNFDRPGLNFAIAALPFFPAEPAGDGALDFGPPPITALVVIPGNIAFLNQFFSVLLMVANVAPDGTPLVLRDIDAQITLPLGLDRVAGTFAQPGDDPLRLARLAGVGQQPVVRVIQPGPDGDLGTADDIPNPPHRRWGKGNFWSRACGKARIRWTLLFMQSSMACPPGQCSSWARPLARYSCVIQPSPLRCRIPAQSAAASPTTCMQQ